MENAQEPNILELLRQVDDYLIIRVLLEMDPIQMTILGATCSQFYRLTSDRKVWRQIIERHGLTDALLKRRGGKANLKRIRVMQKTYVSHLIKQEEEKLVQRMRSDEIQHQFRVANYIRILQHSIWKKMAKRYITSNFFRNNCTHPKIIYSKEPKINVKCDNCGCFSEVYTSNKDPIFHEPNVEEYLKLTNQLDAEQVTFTDDPECEKDVNYIPILQNIIWKQLVKQKLGAKIYIKDQNLCVPLTLIFHNKLNKITCPSCDGCTYIYQDNEPNLVEYLRITNQLDIEKVKLTYDPDYD